MEQDQLTLLEADLLNQQKHIETVYRKLAVRKKASKRDPIAFEGVGFQLHNLYSAFEDLFRLVATHFENHISEQGGWHKELLKRMATDIPGVRPPFISAQAQAILDELRGFRHVFRHSYLYDLDPERVLLAYKRALVLKKIYGREIKDFLTRLKKT